MTRSTASGGVLEILLWAANIAAVLCLLAFFARPSPQKFTHRGRTPAASRLRNVGLALQNYSADHDGRLPPFAVFSKQGQPLLSWRVLLLPYVEQEELYRQFHLDEPWDSPHNLPFVEAIPEVYVHPYRDGPKAPVGYTWVHVFVGKGAAFEGTEGLRLPGDFPDGMSKTILAFQGGQPVPWTKPEDPPYVPDQPLPDVFTLWHDAFNACMADGSVRPVTRQVSEKSLRAAITRNGNDVAGPDF